MIAETDDYASSCSLRMFFFKEVFVHQGCIYLVKHTVKSQTGEKKKKDLVSADFIKGSFSYIHHGVLTDWTEEETETGSDYYEVNHQACP